METKQRGLRRKCVAMVQRISQETEVFPKSHPGYDYWHLHLPISPSQINLSNAPVGVQRLCAQTLINQAHHLATMAPSGEGPIRVVVAIDLPNLWRSQIIVFFGDEYFRSFFERNTRTQKWTRLDDKRSLARDWGLKIPSTFAERGYLQEIDEPDFSDSGEIWFIGQLASS